MSRALDEPLVRVGVAATGHQPKRPRRAARQALERSLPEGFDHRLLKQALGMALTRAADRRLLGPPLAQRRDAVRELLSSDGRTLAQGALAWIWALSPRTVPIPGARTEAQATANAQALDFGPLSPAVMAEIEAVLDRPPEGPPRER